MTRIREAQPCSIQTDTTPTTIPEATTCRECGTPIYPSSGFATHLVGEGAKGPDGARVGAPAEAYEQVRELAAARKEHLVAIYLDAQNRVIGKETVSTGSLNTTRTHPREVFEPAVRLMAVALVLAHNHPSGSLEASRDDIEFTRTMQRAGELMGIPLFDHLIVSRKGYVSLKERGLM